MADIAHIRLEGSCCAGNGSESRADRSASGSLSGLFLLLCSGRVIYLLYALACARASRSSCSAKEILLSE